MYRTRTTLHRALPCSSEGAASRVSVRATAANRESSPHHRGHKERIILLTQSPIQRVIGLAVEQRRHTDRHLLLSVSEQCLPSKPFDQRRPAANASRSNNYRE